MAAAESVSNESSVPEVMKLTSKKDKKQDRIPLFSIDDKEYTVPKKPGFKVVMRYLNVARKSGNDLYAAQALCEDMLGTEAWEEFLAWDDLDDDVMSAVIEKCVTIATSSVGESAEK